MTGEEVISEYMIIGQAEAGDLSFEDDEDRECPGPASLSHMRYMIG